MTTRMLLRLPTDCCWQPRRWEVGHVMAIMLLAFIAMLLSACGGGGGGGGASDDPPAPGLTFPVITSQPVSTAVAAGMTATFGVIASGNGLAFAWQRSTNVGLAWQSIPGASGVSYTTPSLDASANGHQFRVVIQNPAGVVTSSSATLTVTGVAAAPTITRQPQDQVSTPPDPATFSVAVTGSPTPSIRWQFSNDGGRIWSDFSQASSTTYTTPNNSYFRARAFLNGFKYRAVATNASGTITTLPPAHRARRPRSG